MLDMYLYLKVFIIKFGLKQIYPIRQVPKPFIFFGFGEIEIDNKKALL